MLEYRFRKTPEYGFDELIRDLIDTVRELEAINAALRARLDSAEARLDAGGL